MTTNTEMTELDRINQELKEYQEEHNPSKSQSDSWLIARLSSSLNALEINYKRKKQKVEDLEGELVLREKRIHDLADKLAKTR